MNVLFIGGTGIISSACTQLAAERGYKLYLLNRGQSARAVPAGVTLLRGDVRDPASLTAALGDLTFDAVVNWVAFTPEHIEADLAAFRGRTRQYVFISSASAYQKPVSLLPITESTPLHNPFWRYSRDKIACEERLMRAYREDGFPVTIVRPSHTYDQTLLPMDGGYTVVARMRAGRRVIVHGDGTSLWVLTHHRDFAVGFVGLLGNPHALGETFHITGQELQSWNAIFAEVARAAGTTADMVHLPSDMIAAFDPEWGAGLLGDKAHSVIFDNTKIRRVVPDFNPVIPFARGADEIMAWHDADPARQVIDAALDTRMGALLAAYDRMMS
ncbi:SDR family oxidoreductase [Deinococcus sp.]|uniref:SDR family oxidoreductase n=1 Tax=Deinococcus sp. TaxID=47478 RepID=UPI0025D17962|nr:SDR family oxidoreductase [Deinococcus sp.]